MKLFSLIFSFLVVTAESQAQQVTIIDQPKDICAHSYIAEGKVSYFITGCVPGSEVAFCSKTTGGSVLKKAPVDENGTASVQELKKFKPAFVINVRNQANQIEGNKRVFFFDGFDFALENLKLIKQGEDAIISWDASVKDQNDIYFNVLQSKDGDHFEVVGSILPTGTPMFGYSFLHKLKSDKSFYKIQVKSRGSNISYTSSRMLLTNEEVTLYPTVTTDNITISLNTPNTNTFYKILNILGQTLQSGQLSERYNTVSLASLSPATYFISVINKDGLKITNKIIKQ